VKIGSTALYVFLYSAVYYARLDGALWVTSFLYFGYMALISFALFLMTGTIGFTSSLWFNEKIYDAIKVD